MSRQIGHFYTGKKITFANLAGKKAEMLHDSIISKTWGIMQMILPQTRFIPTQNLLVQKTGCAELLIFPLFKNAYQTFGRSIALV